MDKKGLQRRKEQKKITKPLFSELREASNINEIAYKVKVFETME